MRKSFAAAALFAAAAMQPASAADTNCYTAADLEAHHALVLQMRLTVLSSSCNEDVKYGEFKVRNRDALVGYQQAMIDHFRRVGYGAGAQRQFETWFTHLANQAAIHNAGLPSAPTCKETVAQMQLDPKGLHDYLVAHAADPVDGEDGCGPVKAVHKVVHRAKAATHH